MSASVVLAVDDRPDNLFVLEQLVGAYLPDIKMITAKSAAEGLALAAATDIDAALIDVQMPGMSGIEMCRRLKDDPRTASIHVILVTAHRATPELKAQGLEAGADDFIAKPIDNIELAAKLKVMLRLRAGEAALCRERDHLEEAVQERTHALQDAENRYRTLFHAAADAIFINDLEGRLLEVNEETCRCLGYNRDQLLQLAVSDISTAEQVTRRPEILEQLQAMDHFLFETELIPRNGRRIPTECSSSLMEFKGRPAVLSIARDITERKQADEALQAAAHKWRITFDAIGDAVCLLDHESRILQCNQAMGNLVGKPFPEIIGRHCWELVHGTDSPIAGCPLLRLKQSRQREEMVIPLGKSWFKVTADPILDEAGNLTGAVHLIADITRLKRTEEKLQDTLGASIQRQTEIRGLLEASQIVISEPSFEVAARDILSFCKSLIGAKAGYVALFPEDGMKNDGHLLDAGICTDALEPGLLMAIAGLQGEAYPQGKPVRHNDLTNNEGPHPQPTGPGLENVLFAPLLIGEKTVGQLGLINKPGGFSEEDAELTAGFAEFTTIALINKRAEDALRQSEEKYRLLMSQIPAVVFKGYADWSMDFFDQKVEILTGYSQEDFNTRSRTWNDLILPEDLITGKQKFVKAFKGDKAFVWEYRIRKKDGEIRWIQDLVQIFSDSAGKFDHVSGVLFDITDRKQAEERLARTTRALRALSSTNQALLHATEEKGFLTEVCQVMVEEGGYPLAWVGYPREDEAKSVAPVAHAGAAGNNADWINITWGGDEPGLNPGGLAMRTSKIQVAKNIQRDPTQAPWPEEWGRREFNAAIALPLIVDGKTIGILDIFAKDFEAFDSEEVKLLEELAGGVAFGIWSLRTDLERQQAEAEVQQALVKLRKTLDGTVFALANTVEMRDPYTAGHQRRVAQLASAIAQDLGFSPDRVEGMRVLGFLHDLGKIAVPAEILSKPGKISNMEFNLIKGHPQVGYEIIQSINFPWPVAQAILQHHERLDGSGYPNGISGADIILEARILAVADVVEAMGSHRPYRPTLGLDKALEEIIQNRGVLYDPQVVDSCVKLLKEKGFSF